MIYLRWLKKVLRKLGEKENGSVKMQVYRNKSGRGEQSLYPHDSGTENYYGYPKGKFRFPLIPDDPPKKMKIEPVSEKEKTGPSSSRLRQDGGAERRHTEADRKKPFTPTKVPSPVYGFAKPRKYKVAQASGQTGLLSGQSAGKIRARQQTFAEDQHLERRPEERKESSQQHLQETKGADDSHREEESALGQAGAGMAESLPAASDEDSGEHVIGTAEPQKAAEEDVQKHGESSADWPSNTGSEGDYDSPMGETESHDTGKGEEGTVTPHRQQEGSAGILKSEPEEPCPEKPETVHVKRENQVGNDNNEVYTSTRREHNKNMKEINARPIPYNVIMLNADKKKLAEKVKGARAACERPPASVRSDNKAAVVSRQPYREETGAGAKERCIPQNRKQETSDVNGQLKTVRTHGSAPASGAECGYVFPSVDLLQPPVVAERNTKWMEEQKRILNETLKNFHVRARVVHMTQGPSVTRFEIYPEPGVKVSKITSLTDDIKLSLAAKDIRMEAPIPGKHTIGIEVPNQSRRPVLLREIIETPAFREHPSPLTAALGLDISGNPVVTDLTKMPHGLIAGATGSGKSVCINSVLISILYKANPDEVKLLLIDPKMVELAPYNEIPHLLSPVITDVKAATAALKWTVSEMERRYQLFAQTGVRNITRFNAFMTKEGRFSEKLPYIVVVIDELADLMMMSPADVEEAICRVAQKARACGIHLIIATQRPSVDVITGLIKANVPTRIAFSVSSQADSRTIIDMSGAERLLGKGDMLFLENGAPKPVRLQGTFVSDEEIDAVVAHVRSQQSPQYLFEQEELLQKAVLHEEEDELFYDACEFVVQSGTASTSSLQRRFKIGYNRAARLMDMMEARGFISEPNGSKPRDVLITESDLETIKKADEEFSL